MGFYVRAKDENRNDVGYFLNGEGYQKMNNCTAVTHVNSADKMIAHVQWKAPSDRSGIVHFK